MDAAGRELLSEVCYEDQFLRPLTLSELSQSRSLSETRLACEQLCSSRKLEHTRGCYHLPGRSEIVTTRLQRYAISDTKLRAVWKHVRWICAMPFVRAVFLCNSMAKMNGRSESDIDLFVITTPRRIFAARLWTVLYTQMFSHRPRQSTSVHAPDALCLSFFVSEEQLNLQRLRLQPEDPHLEDWMNAMAPIYDPFHLHDTFREVNDLKQPAILPALRRRIQLRWWHRGVQRVLTAASRILSEHWLENLQWRRLPQTLKERANKDSCVVWSSTVLKFHDNDRRQEYCDGWKQRLRRSSL